MIFYFSGTGNSLYVAKRLLKNNEKLVSIAKEMNKKQENYDYELFGNERIIFVYPVYAWAPPKMVMDFVKKVRFTNYKDNYISTVITCGEEVGDAVKVFGDILNSKGLRLNSGFSVVAPNNYIIIGDVDSKEVEDEKLLKLEDSIEYINNILKNKKSDIYRINKGRMPKITTNIINPLFDRYTGSVKKFYVNDNCTGCKVCEKVCNSNCIKVYKKPSWSGNCSQCLACINHCKVKAIQYGKNTIKKGRYINPNIKVSEMYK